MECFFAAGDAEMGAGHKEKITTASDVMSGLRLSLSRRRTIELGLAVGMAFSAPGVRAAEEPPEVFFSPEVSADALILIYEKLSGDLSGRDSRRRSGRESPALSCASGPYSGKPFR